MKERVHSGRGFSYQLVGLPVSIYFYTHFQSHRAEESMGVQGEQGGGEQAGVSECVPKPQTPAGEEGSW